LFLAVLAVAAATLAAVPKPTSPPKETLTYGIWTMKTSELEFNIKTNDFNAPNRITLTRPGGDVTADRAGGNFTKTMTLYGNVVMHDQNGAFSNLGATRTRGAQGPATLTTDQLQIDTKGKLYTAIGHVHYVRGITTVDAQRAMLNDTTHMLYLSGDAKVTQGPRSLIAQHIDYNTVTGQGTASGNVTSQFPSAYHPTIATPKPLHLPHIPGVKKTPAPH
jgi:lipopolysaccharide assembly outer membrane protein LptD (OstA)